MVSTAVESLQSAKNQLLAKISGLENEVKQIEGVIAALAGLESGESVQQIMVVEDSTPIASGKRVMSAATKAKMKKAQQARWAKINAAKVGNASEVDAQPAKKKGMSAAAKAKLSAFQKARWAKINAAKAKAAKKK